MPVVICIQQGVNLRLRCISFQLSEAGLRELQEETGLSLKAEDCSGGKMNFVALWEVIHGSTPYL